jgi:fumarylacetoacetate (FAA) hydrolase
MRLGTLRDGSRDGALIVADRTGKRLARAGTIAPCLQAALDDWESCEPRLLALSDELDRGAAPSEPLDEGRLSAPLPRAFEWVDGSAYLNHVRLVRRARGAALPDGLERDPLVYQGGSGVLLGPRDPLAWVGDLGLDFEGEVAVVLGDVPCGVRAPSAAPCVRLLMLANDVTYRDLIPSELKKGFGFFISKPATAFSPFAVTPDTLGTHFRDGRAHLKLVCTYNGARVGDLDTGEGMHFSFLDLIAHIAMTRSFTAGTILGSGTVSNADPARGVSCLVEKRTLEVLSAGAPSTGYMKPGDRIRIEAFDESGWSVFGAIDQTVMASG